MNNHKISPEKIQKIPEKLSEFLELFSLCEAIAESLNIDRLKEHADYLQTLKTQIEKRFGDDIEQPTYIRGLLNSFIGAIQGLQNTIHSAEESRIGIRFPSQAHRTHGGRESEDHKNYFVYKLSKMFKEKRGTDWSMVIYILNSPEFVYRHLLLQA